MNRTHEKFLVFLKGGESFLIIKNKTTKEQILLEN